MLGNTSKRGLIGLGVFFFLLLLIIEWRPWHSFSSSSPVQSKQVEQLASVALEKNSGTETELQPIRAQLSPITYTTIAAELGAKVQELPFREGENFKRGQKLVSFDCAAQQAQFQKSKASLSIAERNFSANKRLLALGSVGRIEYENSASEFQKAKAENDELAAIVAKCNIFAPFDGRVVEQKVRSQQFVQAGQPVLEILDSSALELEFIAPSKWSPWLVSGYDFSIKIDETGKSYPAKITRVGARIDSISQTVKVAAVINGDYNELSPGMSGTLEIRPPVEQSSTKP